MILVEVLEAIFKLGLPVLVLSWLLIHRQYQTGEIAADADRQTVKSSLKKIRKAWRKDKKGRYNLIENKWMRFGGGFYGITALTTFILIELGEAVDFVVNISGVGKLLEDGLLNFVVNLLVNQFQNFIAAIIWFAYWGDDDRSIVVWIAVPYASYLLGLNLASRTQAIAPRSLGFWIKEIRDKFHSDS